jgi:hypothetical protein
MSDVADVIVSVFGEFMVLIKPKGKQSTKKRSRKNDKKA